MSRDDAEVLARLAAAGVPPDPTPGNADLELTEDGVALRFAEQHAHELRYCHDARRWYLWTGTHWKENRDHLAFSWARELVRSLNRAAEFKTKAVTGRVQFAAGVERFAQADRSIAVTADVWDPDPWLLGTPGGTVDLRSGDLRPAAPGEFITKTTAVAPAAPGAVCDTWLRFLDDATGKDDDLIRFLQQWSGYCLTGSTEEHALLFVYGGGGNGKSVLLNTVSGVLGAYSATAAMDTFSAAQHDRHSTELAMLRGARLVTASETEKDRAWAEARIKQMTGGDPITARFMRQDNFTFRPRFKLTIAGNHKPTLKNIDEAARRRFNIVPFTRKPASPDPQLEEKLRAEWPAILRWMIEGCLDWQANRLARPAVVTAATAEYFDAQDVFGAWVRERCITDPNLSVRPSHLLDDYNTWAIRNAERRASRADFRGWAERQEWLRYKRVNGRDLVEGIGLNPPPQEDGKEAEGGAGGAWGRT
jgi:putative DNA primase/helicase